VAILLAVGAGVVLAYGFYWVIGGFVGTEADPAAKIDVYKTALAGVAGVGGAVALVVATGGNATPNKAASWNASVLLLPNSGTKTWGCAWPASTPWPAWPMKVQTPVVGDIVSTCSAGTSVSRTTPTTAAATAPNTSLQLLGQKLR
jgi:hypothetical protein